MKFLNKISKLDTAIIASGFIISLSAWIRYFTLPSDLGETLLGGIIGVMIMFIGWMHNNQGRLAVVQEHMGEYLTNKSREEEEQ